MPAHESLPESERTDRAALEIFKRLVIEASSRFAPAPDRPVDPSRGLDQSSFWRDQADRAIASPLLNALCRAGQAYWMAYAALDIDSLRHRAGGELRSPYVEQRLVSLRDVDPAMAAALAAQWGDDDVARLHSEAAALMVAALRDCRARETRAAKRAAELVEQASDDIEDWGAVAEYEAEPEPEPPAELRPEVSAAIDLMLRRCFVTAIVDQASRREGIGSVSIEQDAANNITLLKREKVAPSAAELAFDAARRSERDR